MAGLSSIPVKKALGINIHYDDDSDRTVTANVDAGPTTLYSLLVDNSAYATAIYVHIWDNTNPTIGTTAQDLQFLVPASVKREFPFPGGYKFVNGLSWATSTSGGTTASGAPATEPNIYATTNGGD